MKLPRILPLFILAALTFSGPLTSLADTIVDTGPGDDGTYGNPAWSLINLPSSLQAYSASAAKFTLTNDTTITSVEGWMNEYISGSGLVIGIGSSPYLSPNPNPGDFLYSGTMYAGNVSTYHWNGLTDLNWFLAAGDYWVSFVPTPGYMGSLPAGGANPLSSYAFQTTDVPLTYDPSHTFGVRIMGDTVQNVPDNGTTLTLLGAALFGLGIFRRRFAN